MTLDSTLPVTPSEKIRYQGRRMLTRDGRRSLAARIRGGLRGYPGVRIQASVTFSGSGRRQFARGSTVRKGARIHVGTGATLTLSQDASIGANNILNVMAGVVIGERTLLSWNVQIMDTDFHDVVRSDGSVGAKSAPIVLGKHVLVGAGAIILKGVTIGDESVVAAGSVVTRDVPPGVVVAGNPARVVSAIRGWV